MKEPSELKKLEMQLGFTIGILIGAVAAGILVQFAGLAWYWALISAIGSIGIIGNLSLALHELIKMRRNLIAAMKEFDKSPKILNTSEESELNGNKN